MPDFDMNTFLKLTSETKNNTTEIKKAIEKNEAMLTEATEMLRVATQYWQPKLNERAVLIRLSDFTAWPLWFIERYPDGRFRFKETPVDHPSNNYWSINLTESVEDPDFFIIPETFYNQVSQNIKFRFVDDKYV